MVSLFVSCLCSQLHSNCFFCKKYRIMFPRHFGWGAKQALLMNKIHAMKPHENANENLNEHFWQWKNDDVCENNVNEHETKITSRLQDFHKSRDSTWAPSAIPTWELDSWQILDFPGFGLVKVGLPLNIKLSWESARLPNILARTSPPYLTDLLQWPRNNSLECRQRLGQ